MCDLFKHLYEKIHNGDRNMILMYEFVFENVICLFVHEYLWSCWTSATDTISFILQKNSTEIAMVFCFLHITLLLKFTMLQKFLLDISY